MHDLAVIVTCFTKKDGMVLGLQKNFQTRSDRKSGWSWTALTFTIHSLLMLAFSWMDGGCASSALAVLISVTCHMQLDAGCSVFLFIVLWLTKLFNFSQIFICHRSHGSSAAFFAVSSARVTILHKNQTNASCLEISIYFVHTESRASPVSFV